MIKFGYFYNDKEYRLEEILNAVEVELRLIEKIERTATVCTIFTLTGDLHIIRSLHFVNNSRGYRFERVAIFGTATEDELEALRCCVRHSEQLYSCEEF